MCVKVDDLRLCRYCIVTESRVYGCKKSQCVKGLRVIKTNLQGMSHIINARDDSNVVHPTPEDVY